MENKIMVQVQFDVLIDKKDYDYLFDSKIARILEDAGLDIWGIDTPVSWDFETYVKGGK